jgi:ketosteroid isomerase-like protein
MKKLLTLLMMICSLSSYSQTNDEIYQKALLEHNKKIVAHFFDAIEQKEYQLIRNIFDLNAHAIYSNTTANISDTVAGREAIVAYLEDSYKKYYSIHFQKEMNTLNDAKEIVVRYSGTFETSTGEKLKQSSFVTFKLLNGKIVEYVEYGYTPSMAKGKENN